MSFQHLDRSIDRRIHPTTTNQKVTNVRNALYVAASVSAPIVKAASASSGLPGINLIANTIESIFQVAQQISWNKKQSVRLANEARKSFDALKDVIARKGDILDKDPGFIATVERFSLTLRMVEDKLREISREKFIPHLLRYKDIADELSDLERDCHISYNMFMLTMQVDIFGLILQSEQSRKEDRDQLLKELERIKADSGAIMDLLTEKEGKLDQDSINALQIILHKIDNQPEKVLPAIREFAEEATKTLKTRTNVDLPRRPPWLVSAREFQRGEKIREGKNSIIYKATWKKGGMEIVLKDLRNHENIQGLVEDIVRWRDLDHPFLHPFLGAQPIGHPRFFVYKYLRHGNVLDYLKHNRLANRELLLLQVSLGMEYLHRSSIVHGNLRCHNVLIDDQGNALVGDFGIAKHFPEKHRIARASKLTEDFPSFHTASITGSLFWLAPECLETGIHTHHSDLWSFSISSFELLTGGMNPLRQFREEDVWQALMDGYRPSRPTTGISDRVWQIIHQCWSLEPMARSSFASVAVVLGLSLQVDERCLQLLNELLNRQGTFRLLGDPSIRIIQIIRDVIPRDLGFIHDPLPPREEQIVHYCLRVLLLAPQAPWENLLESGILDALLLVFQCPTFVGNRLLCEACSVLAALMGIDSPYLQSQTTIFTAILGSLVAILKSAVEDDSMMTALFAAIATVVLTEPPGTSIVRRVIDTSAISRIKSIITSKTDPALLEQGLEVIRALGSRRGTLTLEEVRSVAPVIVNVMSSTNARVKIAAFGCMAQLLTTSPDQAQVVRQSVQFRTLIPIWEEWDNNGNIGQTAEEQAAIVLAQFPDATSVSSLLELIQRQIRPVFKKAVCQALVSIGQRSDAKSRMALARNYHIIPLFSGLLPSCSDKLRLDLHEVIAAFSSSNDLPTVVVSLSASNPSESELDVALRMLLGMVTSMDEDAKLKEIMNSETLTHLVAVLASADINVGAIRSRPVLASGDTASVRAEWSLVELALDVVSGLLRNASPEFLENASDALLKIDAHIALAALLDTDSVPTTIQTKALSIIDTLTSSTDDAKIEFLHLPTTLSHLRDIVGNKLLPSACRNTSCVILRHLLSIEERETEDEEAFLRARISPALILHMEDPNPDVHGTLSARVLSMLVPLFGSFPDLPNVSDLSDVPIEDAVHALDAYCARSVEQAENVFASRQYSLADYVRHTMPIIRLLGLKIALAFLKGSIDQRRAITSLNGFRADVEVEKQRATDRNTDDANSPDTNTDADIVSTATEVLDRWKITSRRRG